MPTYRVIIDGQETDDFVTGNNYGDAYFDVAARFPLTYQNKIDLEQIDPD